MTALRLKYIHEFRDRHGKVRRYVRLPGGKRVPLPGAPGTTPFMEVYQAALAGEAPRVEIGASRSKAGTVNAAVAAYFASAAFGALAQNTKRNIRAALEKFRVEHGDKHIASLRRCDVERMLAARGSTPGAARIFLSALRALLRHAVLIGLRPDGDDATQGIRRPRLKSGGVRTWSETDIAAFKARHPIGSRARLALELLLGTGQRRSDIVKLGRQHIGSDGMLRLRQQKTGKALTIPVHPELSRAIEAAPRDGLTFLLTERGKPFTPDGFTGWFRTMCDEAGLPPGTTAHGLRKACCRRLAEAGCSASVIAAISGHASLSEVERYTRAADQARMARSGVAAVASVFSRTPRSDDPAASAAEKTG